MKKILAFVLVSAVVIGTVAADPIGLSVYVDGFYFGDLLKDVDKVDDVTGTKTNTKYEFSGTNGLAYFEWLGVKYAKSFGALGLATALDFRIPFAEGGKLLSDLGAGASLILPRWTLKGTYGLDIAQDSKLTFSLYNKLYLYAQDVKDDKFYYADTDADQIQDGIGPGVKFTQTLGFGSIYAQAEADIHIHTGKETKVDKTKGDNLGIDVKSGDDDGIKVGVDTEFGLYGYLQPVFAFIVNGKSPDDVFTAFNVRIGYKTGNLDGRVTVAIPFGESSALSPGTTDKLTKLENAGIEIRPRFTYSDIIPGLAAYVDVRILGIAAKSKDDNGRVIGLNPGIGVIYAF
jgi:hypothetical protein